MHLKSKSERRYYTVSGMNCAACSSRVEKTVSGLTGVDSCTVNLLTGDLRVDGTAEESAVIQSVEKIGYGCSLREDERGKNRSVTEKTAEIQMEDRIKKQLISSAVLLIPLMILSMVSVKKAASGNAGIQFLPVSIAFMEFLFSTVILLINRRYFVSGFRAAVRLTPNMDTLIMLGSGISWLWSTGVMIRMCSMVSPAYSMQHAWEQCGNLLCELYFESAAMIPTLITVGKLLEAKAKGKTTTAVNSLKMLRPQTAHRIDGGEETEVSAEALHPGDRFKLRPGESVPADGVILEGKSLLDESMLSGESRPVEKFPLENGKRITDRNRVFAASINKTGCLLCECEKTGNDTVLSQIIRMVTDAAATKAPAARTADKAAAVFVPAVLLISILTFLLWLIAGEETGTALQRAIAVLVISCPCALGLATPVAIMVANGVGAKNGILFKTAESLEQTGKMKVAVFDKTGTLTTGRPRVCAVIPAEGIAETEFLKIICSIETASEHPLAKSIVDYVCSRGIRPEEIREYYAGGSSVSAVLPEGKLTAGSRRSAVAAGAKMEQLMKFDAETVRRTVQGQTPLYFVLNGKLTGMVFCEDSVREDAARTVAELKELGLKTVLLTGDDEAAAGNAAEKAGIREVTAGVLPAEKAETVRRLREQGAVMMIGDGINDAPALTAADIGAAVASGTDVAMDAADVVLMKSEMRDVPAAIRLSRETLKTIRQNLFWAVFYNALCIPAAAGLLIKPFGISVSPMFGAAAMSLSSLFVVTNALRLNRVRLYSGSDKEETDRMNTELKIKGMMCPHCEARVKQALEQVQGVENVSVSYEKGNAVIFGNADTAELEKAVTDAGYEVV